MGAAAVFERLAATPPMRKLATHPSVEAAFCLDGTSTEAILVFGLTIEW